MISRWHLFKTFLLFGLLLFAAMSWGNKTSAGELQLTWTDNSTNEDGFTIERKAGTAGTYAPLTTVGANVSSYTDSTLVDGATYCYRLFAFNSGGNSPYSNDMCGVARSTTFAFSVTKSGTGSGTVTSTPTGINCGNDCSESYTNGTSVNLTATPALGSIFAGWSGNSDCSDGSVTMNASKSCTATFNLQIFSLSVSKAGTGSGSVMSAPTGINCGNDCSESYTSGTSVTLTATPASGSIFAGWSGNADCSDGSLTMNANKSCMATFNINPTPQTYTLDVTVIKSLTSTGTGDGTVTSTPTGINCGSDCSESYTSGTSVTLTATPASGSIFAGWSGDADCSDGSVTMNASKSCAATFNLQPFQIFSLSVVKASTGAGTVTSSPAGINCGGTCTGTYNDGTIVALTATADAGSTFTGWSGTGCSTGSVTLNTDVVCTATFQPLANLLTTRIGVFRPDTGEWFLDSNGNGQWDGCDVDICISSFGQTGKLPVVGSWTGNGTSNIGTFDSTTGEWQLDTNGNGQWDGCGVDTCIASFGKPGDLPVTREIGGSKVSIIGTFTPRSTVKVGNRKRTIKGLWNFDLNGNATSDGCSIDECDIFGTAREIPVVGDWYGVGSEQIGVFLPRYGKWYLDVNGNGAWDGCSVDKCLGRFGKKGDIPVVGDWDGTGNVRIGVYRPSTGEWFLDMNGNGKLDDCTVDACIDPFGQPGDWPVVGKW
jgi:hypothetical protein